MGRSQVHKDRVGKSLVGLNVDPDRCREMIVHLDDLVAAFGDEQNSGIHQELRSKLLDDRLGDVGAGAGLHPPRFAVGEGDQQSVVGGGSAFADERDVRHIADIKPNLILPLRGHEALPLRHALAHSMPVRSG